MMALVVAASWLPLMALSSLEVLLKRSPEPLVRDLSVHARLLIALPAILAADRLLDLTAGSVVRRLFSEGFVPADRVKRVEALLARVIRWRDSVLPELLLVVLALSVGIASLVGISS